MDGVHRPRDECKARLHNLVTSGRVPFILAALAAHLRREPLEFAVETVRGRSEQVPDHAMRIVINSILDPQLDQHEGILYTPIYLLAYRLAVP